MAERVALSVVLPRLRCACRIRLASQPSVVIINISCCHTVRRRLTEEAAAYVILPEGLVPIAVPVIDTVLPLVIPLFLIRPIVIDTLFGHALPSVLVDDALSVLGVGKGVPVVSVIIVKDILLPCRKTLPHRTPPAVILGCHVGRPILVRRLVYIPIGSIGITNPSAVRECHRRQQIPVILVCERPAHTVGSLGQLPIPERKGQAHPACEGQLPQDIPLVFIHAPVSIGILRVQYPAVMVVHVF